MPWKILTTMDQRIQLIAHWKSNNYTITDLSKICGVSRPTVYKWLSRYKTHGIDGLQDQDSTPLYNPHTTKDAIVKLIITEKLKNHKRGPKKICARLKIQHPDIKVPAPSTIGEWLKKNGLVTKRKKRLHVPPYTEPFEQCQKPNNVWSADYKGQFHMRDGHMCYPLTISDNYSRYLLKCHGLPGPRYSETRAVFERAFREYGLPDAIRSDNGTPFAGRCSGGLSRLSIWWIQLGIIPERIDKGCPQQNGRHERMHRTLKTEALGTMACNMKDQQRRFDVFCLDYNNYRPHESLGQQPPAQYYQKSKRLFVENQSIPNYDSSYAVRHVRSSGDFSFRGHIYFISELLSEQPIGLKEIADGQWAIYYSFHRIGTIDLRKNKIIR